MTGACVCADVMMDGSGSPFQVERPLLFASLCARDHCCDGVWRACEFRRFSAEGIVTGATATAATVDELLARLSEAGAAAAAAALRAFLTPVLAASV